MKCYKFLIFALSLALLLFTVAVSSLCEETQNTDVGQFSFPTTHTDTQGGLNFPTPMPTENKTNTLPNPSRVLKALVRIVHEQLDMGSGLVVNSYEYCVPSISQDTVNAYLVRCAEAGYDVESVTISNIPAYQISDGSYTAFFMPSYDHDYPLLILQVDMPIQPEADDNTLYMTINGKSYILSYADHIVDTGKTGEIENSQVITGYTPKSQIFTSYGDSLLGEVFIFRSDASKPGDVMISIPSDGVEKTYKMQKDSLYDEIGMQINSTIFCGLRQKIVTSTSISILGASKSITGDTLNRKILTTKYNYSIDVYTNALKNKQDYLKITVEHLGVGICQCSFEGSFNSGKDSIFGSFRYVP